MAEKYIDTLSDVRKKLISFSTKEEGSELLTKLNELEQFIKLLNDSTTVSSDPIKLNKMHDVFDLIDTTNDIRPMIEFKESLNYYNSINSVTHTKQVTQI